jgi:hypothetical protein
VAVQSIQNISRECPNDAAVFCLVFAENFTYRAQDASQGFHWNNTQVTIHSIVATYKGRQFTDSPKIVNDSMVFISDDLTHDHHAVQNFVDISIKKLLEESKIDRLFTSRSRIFHL